MLWTNTGPKVTGDNCGFGYPERQGGLPLMESDLFEVMQAVTDGKLADTEVKFCDKSACCVIMASKGYPLKYEKGFDIDIPADIKPYVYVAGAVKKDGRLLTSGGRVLGVTATADTLSDAVKTAYERVEKISFKTSYYRKDIGKKALLALSEDK